MDSFQKFMMVQCAKVAVSTILVEGAGILLGTTVSEQSAKQQTIAESNQILEELKLRTKNQKIKKENKSE